MIVHVAEAGEARGRVVLRCGVSPAANDGALKAAIHVAKAYHAEIEVLFVEDQNVFTLADHSFSREVALADGSVRTLEAADLQRQYLAVHEAERRRILAAASAAGLEARYEAVRDDEISALIRCCAASGPWNVVVLAEPFGGAGGGLVSRVLAAVEDSTGVIVATRKSAPRTGPIVVAAEDEVRLAVMLRAAERLATVGARDIRILLVASSYDDLHWLEAQARLLAAGNKRCIIESNDVTCMAPRALAERIEAIKPAFLITRHGGLVLPQEGYQPLTSTLRCPIFCIR